MMDFLRLPARAGRNTGWPVAAALTLMAGAALAETGLDADEASVLPRVLSAVAVEISAAHNGPERAILLSSADPDAADLAIFSGPLDGSAPEPVAVVRGLVWAGRLGGQVPWLKEAENGSLLVHSEQTGIGRNPWEQTLTLAERDGEIRVAGYTLNQWDRVLAHSARCDWDLLTGDWVLEIEADGDPQTRTGNDPRVVTVADWALEQDGFPRQCQVDLSAG